MLIFLTTFLTALLAPLRKLAADIGAEYMGRNDVVIRDGSDADYAELDETNWFDLTLTTADFTRR